MRFKDKAVIVTGSGRGIGRAIALAFAEEGADLVLADINPEKSVEEEARKLGHRVSAIRTDVSVLSDVEAMTKTALEEYGRIDILVNNAAATEVRLSLFHDMTPEECDLQLNVTLKGVLNCCRAVAPPMLRQGSGSIINITSSGAKVLAPYLSVYAACKAGVAHFSRALAQELGHSGIRVNCIAPGPTQTPGAVKALTQEGMDNVAASQQPLHRVADPADIARAVLFLASDEASHITGQHLSVDGGLGPY